MGKTIDFSRTVYDICRDDPEVINIMKDLGFDNIVNPAMLNTAGRFVTIPKGADMKGISLERIRQEFVKKGYIIKEEGP